MSNYNSKIVLEKYVKGYLQEKIDLNEYSLDLERFDNNRSLFDYQRSSIENISRLLIDYFYNNSSEELATFYDDELSDDFKKEITFKPGNKHYELLKEEFHSNSSADIPYTHFLNRASFWMATGSGKTLIIVKLIEILYELMSKDIIPNKKVLIITPNDEIFRQIENHIHDFNKADFRFKSIQLKNIREYEQLEFAGINPLQPDSLTVYHTRSTLLSDENKENLIDYKTILEREGWYVILDEAHKGTSDESIRKQYINILSKNGFLFNFSATFTDLLDIISTISNFNLTEFIKAGYGKNIKILNEEFKNFRAKNKDEKTNNLNDYEKEEIILKSLIIFTAVKKNYKSLRDQGIEMYHNPLMLTISHEINTKSADMKLYFKYLSKIASGNIKQKDLNTIKDSIVEKLRENIEYSLGDESLDEAVIQTITSITYQDILQLVFSSNSSGSIEVYQIGTNNNELSFRLKTSTISEPFAIIKASDVSKWKNNVLEDYVLNEDVVTHKSRFKDIHKKGNGINILMGSRQFIEGWDSNRPNVVNFINMGTNEDNTKLILQALGRGVRVEPLPNVRKRFKLTTESITEFSGEKREKVLRYSELLETLFVFATNKQVVSNIINEINFPDEWLDVKGIRRTKIKEVLKVPEYKTINSNDKDFLISQEDLVGITQFVNSTPEKLLIVRDDIKVETINSIKSNHRLKLKEGKSKIRNLTDFLRRIERHFNMASKELIGFRDEVKNIDIKHYRKIQTVLSGKELLMLETMIKEQSMGQANLDYDDEQQELVNDLMNIYQSGRTPSRTLIKMAELSGINLDKVIEAVDIKKLERELQLELKYIEAHYYKPLLLSSSDKYRNIITHKSEKQFIYELEQYLQNENNKSKDFDWWYFSKLVEGTDLISIPYYDTFKQGYRDFYPDFIFWMKKNDKYFIKFVDPKGLIINQHNAREKIKGFEHLIKSDAYNNAGINLKLFFYNEQDSGDALIECYRMVYPADLFSD